MSLWSKSSQLIQYILREQDGAKTNKSYPQKLSTGQRIEVSQMRHAVLTSTFNNVLDSSGTLSEQSLSKAHREPLRGLARGVLVAIGIALCFMPEAGSTKPKEYISYKEYAYLSLDYNLEEYKCLSILYGKESAWNPDAVNGSHYGIPQGKSEWLKDQSGYVQIQWGLSYIGARYGTVCKALDHWRKYNWH